MTDKEKLRGMLSIDCYGMDTIEAILICFLEAYGDSISIRRIYDLMETLTSYLGYRIDNLESARFVANERARYIKNYLEGKTWLTEEAARKNLQPQIDNAQAIIDACKLN